MGEARQAPESTVGQPMAVGRQGIYVEYPVEYSKCCALNGRREVRRGHGRGTHHHGAGLHVGEARHWQSHPSATHECGTHD
eukprot:8692689-Pyramimonas_sp.AAC.1